jgi:ParB/RepB/Spo0J family partition protein
MTTEAFAHIPLEHIVTSLTNPRKHFDATKLAELADSIRASGVHQPVLVRPLPGDRLADTAHLEPRPQWELVSGERRVRASIMAELDTIPAMVRALSDDQTLEIQIVENLQRADLQPLEEAEGYEHLMTRHHPPLNADEVAAKIGKSRSYVYARLKLLDLGTEGREALRDGAIEPSVALLLARIPDTKRQAEALEQVRGDPSAYDPDPMSARDAAAYIQRDFMLKLANARFSTTDADLVPSAGSCKVCPKRTGANPDLFADVKGADVCTDTACYHQKEQAHADAQLAQAHANGQTVITGREAQELMPSKWATHVEGYLRLDDTEDSPDRDKPLRELIGPQMEAAGVQPVLVANPHKDGELVAVLPREKVSELLLAKGYEAQAAKLHQAGERQAAMEAEREKQERKKAFEEGWRWRVLEEAHTAAQASPTHELPKSVTSLVCQHYVGLLNQERAKPLAKLLELGKVAPKEGLMTLARETDNPWDLLMLLVAHKDADYAPWLEEHQPNVPRNVGLLLVAQDVGVDVDAVKTALKTKMAAELRAETKARKAQEAAAAGECGPAGDDSDPARQVAPSSGGGGASQQQKTAAKNSPAKPKTPKLTSQAAKQSIADAMKAAEPTPGDDARGTETTPDGASAVGETSRATAPDASATPTPTAGPDPLLIEARRIVVTNQKASVSYVQRVLKVGYNTAAKLLDELESMGVVGPEGVSAYREVLVAAPALVVVAGDDDGEVSSGDGIEPDSRVMVLEGEHAGAVGTVVKAMTVATDEPPMWLVKLDGTGYMEDLYASQLAALHYTEGARVVFTGDDFTGKHATLIEQDYNQPENQKPTRWLVRVDGLLGDYLLTEDEMQLIHPDEQPGGLVVEGGAA